MGLNLESAFQMGPTLFQPITGQHFKVQSQHRTPFFRPIYVPDLIPSQIRNPFFRSICTRPNTIPNQDSFFQIYMYPTLYHPKSGLICSDLLLRSGISAGYYDDLQWDWQLIGLILDFLISSYKIWIINWRWSCINIIFLGFCPSIVEGRRQVIDKVLRWTQIFISRVIKIAR